MQRIDENTYIDDTLVTCAEYQLFIDEMREQGQYFQPDHWTSYQFPVGQAREPILGVRHSDAVEFSGWLTQRQGGVWRFRLPNQEEANAFAMKLLEKTPLGYWFDGNNHFIWIGSIPKDGHAFALDRARNLLSSALDRAIEFDDFLLFSNHDFASDLHRALARNSAFVAHTRGVPISWVILSFITTQLADFELKTGWFYQSSSKNEQRTKILTHYFATPNTRDYNLYRTRTSALNFDLGLAFVSDCNPELISDLVVTILNRVLNNDQVRAHVRALIFVLDRVLDRDHERVLDRERDSANERASAHARDLDSILSSTLDHDRTLALALARDLTLDTYIDLLVLQERIAGRSPAFEGIRLVKYR